MELRERIIESAKEIFSTMLMMEISATEDIMSGDTIPHIDSISGVIGLAGTHKGVLAIHLPNRVAMAVTSGFLGMDVDEINSDVEDAVGELANMLGGNIKSILSEKGRDINLSMPTTISGRHYDYQSNKDAERILIQFRCEAGHFTVELQLEK
ncbi:MAG: chemotaxis protein CheX [Proteobacteria bacterium]|nr:chemotaxis protein CheX [Pseudomonadota bacterium]